MTIRELRAHIGARITGDAKFDGSVGAYSRLTPDQQITITNEMKRYIKANPDGFSPMAVQLANTPPIPLTEKYSFRDMFADFVSESINQANSLNPLSEQNRTNTFLAVLVVVAVYAAIRGWKS